LPVASTGPCGLSALGSFFFCVFASRTCLFLRPGKNKFFHRLFVRGPLCPSSGFRAFRTEEFSESSRLRQRGLPRFARLLGIGISVETFPGVFSGQLGPGHRVTFGSPPWSRGFFFPFPSALCCPQARISGSRIEVSSPARPTDTFSYQDLLEASFFFSFFFFALLNSPPFPCFFERTSSQEVLFWQGGFLFHHFVLIPPPLCAFGNTLILLAPLSPIFFLIFFSYDLFPGGLARHSIYLFFLPTLECTPTQI